MTCHLTWGVGSASSGKPYATLFCRRCMAPIRHRLALAAARELRDTLIDQGHLCRREHALPAPVPAGITTTHEIEAEMDRRKG